MKIFFLTLVGSIVSVTGATAPGDVDSSFNTGTGPNANVTAVAIQPDLGIIVSGGFTSIDGISANRIARLTFEGAVDSSFEASLTHAAEDVFAYPDGKILVVGGFNGPAGTRKGIERFNLDGSVDLSFDPGLGANGQINAVGVDAQGRIVIGGSFTGFNSTERSRIARLHSDGTLDEAFYPRPGPNSTVNVVALDGDGNILIGGAFSSVNDVQRPWLARLSRTGNLDASFAAAGTVQSPVSSIVIQSDARIVISSGSTIMRLYKDGRIDQSFIGKGRGNLVIPAFGGQFFINGSVEINNVHQFGFGRLHNDGSVDTSFGLYAGVTGKVEALLSQPDGKLLIAGLFSRVNGTDARNIARLHAEPPGVISEPPTLGHASLYFGVNVSGTIGSRYRIESSASPSGPWEEVETFRLPQSPFNWIDKESAEKARRYYRAVLVD